MTGDVYAEVACGRWCAYCGHVVYEGCHGSNGNFDAYSVLVSEAEIDAAIKSANLSIKYTAQLATRRDRATIRYCIALGYHSMARQR